MRKLIALPLLLLPGVAAAAPQCQSSAARALQLDLAGIQAVRFQVNAHNLHLRAAANAAPSLGGRACAERAERLPDLVVEQHRDGRTLVVELRDRRSGGLFSGGKGYAYLDIQASLPDTLPVSVDVGSGDAWLTGTPSLDIDVGSGDAEIRAIKGRVDARVGSGDLDVIEAGALKVAAVGSGDVKARQVRGAVEVATIGSGDLRVNGAGAVKVGSVGSGDVKVADIQGDVSVQSIGSGDLEARNVGGALTLRSRGSGEVKYDNVRGPVSVPREH